MFIEDIQNVKIQSRWGRTLKPHDSFYKHLMPLASQYLLFVKIYYLNKSGANS